MYSLHSCSNIFLLAIVIVEIAIIKAFDKMQHQEREERDTEFTQGTVLLKIIISNVFRRVTALTLTSYWIAAVAMIFFSY